jgi:hypothetical protein
MSDTPTNPIEQFARLNPSFGVLPDRTHADQHRYVQYRERALALGGRVTAAEALENAAGRAYAAMTVRNRAQVAQHGHDRQETFAQLNPDFGVLPDARDPQQHQFAQQRERALALGERVAAAEQSGRERGEPSDIVYLPRRQATPPAPAERATDQRQGTRRRLLDGVQRRQAVREPRLPARASRSTRTRANPADQERER